MTELYNRRLFVSLAQKSLAMAKRNKFSYALLFIDLDRFKKSMIRWATGWVICC